MFIRMSLLSLFTIILLGCDGEPPKSKIKNPLAGQVEALEKAKAVEKQLLDAQKRTQDTIDKATK